MTFASIEEVWGNNFCKSKTHKKSKSKNKKKKNKQKDEYADYSDDLIEQFENFNSQINANSNLENNIYKDQVEIIESSPDEEDELDGEDEDENIISDYNNNESIYERVNNVDRRPSRQQVRNNQQVINNQQVRNNQVVRNDQESSLQSEIQKMNDKINFILDKIKSIDTIPLSDNVNKNIYDIILFIVFGLFIILVFESISKLLLKNTDKLVCIPKMKIPTLNE